MALSPPSLFYLSSSPSSTHYSTKKLLLSWSAPSSSLRCGSATFISTLPAHGARRFLLFSAVQPVSVEDGAEEGAMEVGSSDVEARRKLFVGNLPFSFGAPDIRTLFGQCGTVEDVEIIKHNGKLKGFAFITMASAEEASCVVEKFESSEVQDRIISVQYAKSLKKPSKAPGGPPNPSGETPYKIYVSNLSWKARSSHLRELFSVAFKPVSSRVVFDAPIGRSAGYGFVSFATMKEAEAAVQALDGKVARSLFRILQSVNGEKITNGNAMSLQELMGRPLRLRISQKKIEETVKDQTENKDVSQDQSNSS